MKKGLVIGIIVVILIVALIIIFYPSREEENNMSYTPGSEISKLYPTGNCCCEFLTDDIMNEELMLVSECANRNRGQCIEVDPLRLTPHSCCPNAPGETCGSLVN